MTTTHSCIAEIITNGLAPAHPAETESAEARGHRAIEESWSLRRLLGRLLGRLGQRLRGTAVRDEAVALDAAIRRLSELSPHLLLDVGLDPATGRALGDDEVVLRVWPDPRAVEIPERVVAPEAPQPKAARPRILVLPDPILAAETRRA